MKKTIILIKIKIMAFFIELLNWQSYTVVIKVQYFYIFIRIIFFPTMLFRYFYRV